MKNPFEKCNRLSFVRARHSHKRDADAIATAVHETYAKVLSLKIASQRC